MSAIRVARTGDTAGEHIPLYAYARRKALILSKKNFEVAKGATDP